MSEQAATQSPAEAARPSRLGRLLLVGIVLSATVLAFGLVYLTEDTTLSPHQREARAEIRRLQTFFQQHQRILGRFPSEQEGFKRLVEVKLIAAEPVDPWGHPYVYRYDGKTGNVLSLGADGKPGGTGEDADLDGRGVLGEVRP